jgi:hypothetical protein
VYTDKQIDTKTKENEIILPCLLLRNGESEPIMVTKFILWFAVTLNFILFYYKVYRILFVFLFSFSPVEENKLEPEVL